MTTKYQSVVLKGIRDALNSVKATLEIPKVSVDELSTQKDSISVGIETGEGSKERIADCTGTAYSGTLRVSLVYRAMQSVSGMDDLNYMTLLDNCYQYLRANYKSISGTGWFLDGITQPEGAVLSQVYQGGVKDFKTIILVEYERSV